MNEPQINNPWLAERAREVRANIAELRREVEPLEYLQLGWRPPEGGWSIAQVLEHLIITDESYLDKLEPLLAGPPRHPNYDAWRASLLGGLLVRSQRPDATMKVKTPTRWRPGPEPRADPLADYLQRQERLITLIERADGHDLRRTRLHSPISRLVRLNLGDAIMTLVVHTQRHLQQIRRIKQHADFP